MSSAREDGRIDRREGLNLDVVSEISGEEGVEGGDRCVGSGIGSTSENQSDTVSRESSLEIIHGGEPEGSRSASTSSRNSWGDQREERLSSSFQLLPELHTGELLALLLPELCVPVLLAEVCLN